MDRSSLHGFGWWFVNIAAPLLLPIVGTLGMRLFDLTPEQRDRARFWMLVKDGQLGWLAAAFSATGMYEWYTVHTVSEAGGTRASVYFTVSVMAFSVGALSAAVGSVIPTRYPHLRPFSWHGQRLFLVTTVCLFVSIVSIAAL